MFDFRRIFQPTADEQIGEYERLLTLYNERIGYCSTCIHYKPSQMPGFVEDYGECNLAIPLFYKKATSRKNINCLYYEKQTIFVETLKRKIEQLKM